MEQLEKYLLVFKGGTSPKTKLEKAAFELLQSIDRTVMESSVASYEKHFNYIKDKIDMLNKILPSVIPLKVSEHPTGHDI